MKPFFLPLSSPLPLLRPSPPHFPMFFTVSVGHAINQSKHPFNFPEEAAELAPVSYYYMFIWLHFLSIDVSVCVQQKNHISDLSLTL